MKLRKALFILFCSISILSILSFQLFCAEMPDDDFEESKAEGRFVMSPYDEFIELWRPSGGIEIGSSPLFIIQLCDLLGVPKPDTPRPRIRDNSYTFEAPVELVKENGSKTVGRIDLYKKGAFIWESKQGSPKISQAEKEKSGGWRVGTAVRGTRGWDAAMIKAYEQAVDYARSLPKEDGRPPFILVADIGYVVETYADFNNTGVYTPYPNAREHRIYLEDIRKEEIRERLRLIWTNPLSLDPSREREKVTRGIAVELGNLARSLENSGHDPEDVSRFLMKLIFTFFAEDTNLLPKGYFSEILDGLKSPEDFEPNVSALWVRIRSSQSSMAAFDHPIRRFHVLFIKPKSLPINQEQLDLLRKAAKANWASVEPPIFGTLLERALNPEDRHKLGAHFTPTAYVERLVYPTIMEPLRADWRETIQAALALVEKGEREGAIGELRGFHERLSRKVVLDPSCGSGNFLAAAYNLMADLEAEVIEALKSLGQTDLDIINAGHQVSLGQFRGIEISPHAASITELVLTISYAQKHYELYGNVYPPAPTMGDIAIVEKRDAILAWDQVESESGGVKRVPRRSAPWPEASFIIGNPPFLGRSKMKMALGDAYVEGLKAAYPEIPGTTDLVGYFMGRAMEEVVAGRAERLGLIATNSITQSQGRQVLDHYMKGEPSLSLVFAIPDHPWVDAATADSSSQGQVRIAMIVGARGRLPGTLATKILERSGLDDDGFKIVNFNTTVGVINSNLTVGVDLTQVKPLVSNAGISSNGVTVSGKGFLISKERAEALGLGRISGLENHIKPLLNGNDLAGVPREVLAIDFFGLTEEQTKRRYPETYGWLVDQVKPERDKSREKVLREKWWVFGRPREELREALAGLPRYVGTPTVAKRRYFVFLESEILPANSVMAIASDDAYILGVLSSRIHSEWILATGGRHSTSNSSVYVKSVCFDAFPFPEASEGQKERIRALAERIDAHRKDRQAEFPKLALTNMYAVLEDMYYGVHLDEKKEKTRLEGDLNALFSLHQELDAAVAEAYGWPADLSTETLLERLAALNHQRAEEEGQGRVLWLRPDFQARE